MNRTRPRLSVELLEDRAVPATLSIGDATATEGDSTMRYTDTFVPPGYGGLSGARDVIFGPTGDMFVVSRLNNSVMRYDGQTGAFISQFVPPDSGGLNTPKQLAFDSQGDLYVSSAQGNQILRYDGTTGAFLGVFVDAGAGGMIHPAGIGFGPDGNLYVADMLGNKILRFQGPGGTAPGSFMDVYALGPFSSSGGGVGFITFGPDGRLYGEAYPTGGLGNYAAVFRATGVPGAVAEVYVAVGSGGLDEGRDLTFDASGNLLVTDEVLHSVLRYQGPGGASPGAFIDSVIPTGAGGLSRPYGIAQAPDGYLYVSSYDQAQVLRYGPASVAAFTVRLDAPSAIPVSVQFATAEGTAAAGSDYAFTSGTLTFAPGQTSRTILIPTIDDATAEGPETFSLILSNPVGATIADGTGAGTITDEGTKFFVADDGTDRTYRYGAPGNGHGTSELGSGNTAPRGAASTAAGDRVWVVDANKKVYVYDAAGNPLGSWTAGGLTGAAQVEGITVWGNDVWIVDAKQDKVFRYAGAATRLSGSQNAASSFALNSGNRDPKDLVTDGASIWVVNNSSTDKVFKYTLSGSHQGNWTLSGGGGSPTGITLDPSAPAHLWVVDNSTDRVYQYDNAVGRTSGSQSASTSFALAAGNTNPQGIADPPVPQLPADGGHHGWGYAAPLDANDLLDRMARWRKRR